jgi:uncharacterized protein YvpB
MTAVLHTARIGAFAFAVGVGIFIATDGSGVASAAPNDSGSSSTSSTSSAGPASGKTKQSSPAQHRRAPASVPSAPAGAAATNRSTAFASPSTARITLTQTIAPPRAVVVKARPRTDVLPSAPVAPIVPAAPTAPSLVSGALEQVRRDQEAAAASTMLGNPTRNAKYWTYQIDGNSCVLASTAMIIGQLTGRPVPMQEIIKQAIRTPSVVDPTKKMYLGGDSSPGVDIKDAVALLKIHGIIATTTDYTRDSDDTRDPTVIDKELSDQALNDLKAALAAGKATMVGVNNTALYKDFPHQDQPGQTPTANHQVVVIGYDTATDTVYIDDGGWPPDPEDTGRPEGGKNMPVKLDTFLAAWKADEYELTVAVRGKSPTTRVSNVPTR